MTSPAITIGPDANVPAAARLMTEHHVRMLPVTDQKGKLVGIVSRRDLISVFLRPDADIAADIRRVLDDILLARPGEADVAVHNGIVTLTGTLDPRAGTHGDLIPFAVRLMWDVNGVVDIVDRLGQGQAARRCRPCHRTLSHPRPVHYGKGRPRTRASTRSTRRRRENEMSITLPRIQGRCSLSSSSGSQSPS